MLRVRSVKEFLVISKSNLFTACKNTTQYIASGADQGKLEPRPSTRMRKYTEAMVPAAPASNRRYQQALPSDSPKGGSLKHKVELLEVGGRPRNQYAARSRRHKTPRRNRAGGTHCRSHFWTPASHQCNLTPDTRARAASPPKTRLDPLRWGVPYAFWKRPREFRKVPFVQRRAVTSPGHQGRLCAIGRNNQDDRRTRSHSSCQHPMRSLRLPAAILR